MVAGKKKLPQAGEHGPISLPRTAISFVELGSSETAANKEYLPWGISCDGTRSWQRFATPAFRATQAHTMTL